MSPKITIADICPPYPSSNQGVVLFIVPNRLTYVHPCMPVIPLVPSDSPTLISSLLRLSAHHVALAALTSQPLKSGTLVRLSGGGRAAAATTVAAAGGCRVVEEYDVVGDD